MWPLKHYLRKAPRAEITVCWVEEGISFVLWGPRAGRVRVCRGSRFLEAGQVTPGTYRECLATLAGMADASDYRLCWAVLEEAFPRRDPPVGIEGGGICLPDWIERCWKGLEMEDIPQEILSARRAIEKELARWSEYETSGTGICLQVGDRILFLGQGNGKSVHRLSRKGLAGRLGSPGLSKEWLLQTRLLFRNQTSSELRRVHLPDGCECVFSWEGEEPFEIIPGLRPPAWTLSSGCEMDNGLLFLHSGALRGSEDTGCRLTFSHLERRRRARNWDRRLKTGSCLLLGGWSFLLMGACRHEVMAVPDAMPAGEFDSLRAQVYSLEDKWLSHRRLEESRHLPYRLVGAISGSLPEGIEFRRIQIRKTSGKEARQMDFHVEGEFQADCGTTKFRRWIDHIESGISRGKLKNIRFDRNEDRILFALQGIVEDQEGSR